LSYHKEPVKVKRVSNYPIDNSDNDRINAVHFNRFCEVGRKANGVKHVKIGRKTVNKLNKETVELLYIII